MISSVLFEKLYKRTPQQVAFTPYRICPLGAHVDHQLGPITGFAIDKGIHIAYGPKENGVIELSSMQFEGRAQWHVSSVPQKPMGDWADHLRGATRALVARYPLRRGLCGVINGELPIGGLSSSAAVIITFISALAKINGISLAEAELIELALEAENKYVGVSCGRLDQSCEVYCRKDKLLYMDLKTDERSTIPSGEGMKPYKIAIFFSGVERSLATSKYNARVDEAKAAAYALLAHADMDYGKFADVRLSDVPKEVFEQYADRLPEPWRKRAVHYYTECERVERGVKAWQQGDIEEFGKCIFESGHSSIYNWEAGSPELIALYKIMRNTEGIYGGRFSGAGFKGCCMAIIDPDYEDSIIEKVTFEYLKVFPEFADKFSVHICQTADGVKL